MNKKEFLRGRPFDELDALLMQDGIENEIGSLVLDMFGSGFITNKEGFKVTGSASNMNINISSGVAYTNKGHRLAFSGKSVTLSAAHATNNRIDVIALRKVETKRDNFDTTNKYGLGNNFVYSRDIEYSCEPIIYTGAAAPTPVKPTVPADEIEICQILVRTRATNTGEAGIITDLRTLSTSKVLSGTTSERPTDVPIGQPYYDTTIKRYVVWNGAAWEDIDKNALAIANNKVDKVAGKELSTNDYTTAEKNKLAGIANNANNYIHPATHSLDEITETSTKKIMTSAERNKLSGVADNANNYVHPANHPASMITESATKRFVTDTQITNWDGKETPTGAQAKVDALANRRDNPNAVTAAQTGAYTKVESDGKYETPSGAQSKVNTHESKKDNPHNVTASQVGAYTKAESDGRYETPTNAQAKVNTHASRTDNPHGVTKNQIGLNNVENYPIATKAQAEAGAISTAYMTPLRAKELIEILVYTKAQADANYETPAGAQAKVNTHESKKDNPHAVTAGQVGAPTKAEFDTHTNNKSNPHGVTKAQIGLGSVLDYGLSTKAEAEAGNIDTKYMTPLRTKEAILKLAPTPTATNINLNDAGNYYTTKNIEGAFQEIGNMLNASRGSLINSINDMLRG